MFNSRSYSLSRRSDITPNFTPLEKITYRNDITDEETSPSNPFNRRNRPSTLPARYKRPTSRSSSTPDSFSDQSLPNFSSKSWIKDEEEDGAIFTASLKKIRYRSGLSASNEEKANLSCMLWETLKVRVIKAATLQKLVEHLTPAQYCVTEEDSGFLLCFLCTYKTFATTEEVLDLLLQRYKDFTCKLEEKAKIGETANNILNGIKRVLSIWLDQYPSDFDEQPFYPSLHKIINFAKHNKGKKSPIDLLKKTENLLDNLSVSPFLNEDPFKFKFCNCDTPVGCSCDAEISPTFKNEVIKINEDLCIASFEASLVAEQLTLVDAELFKRVIPRHCLACYWSKRDRLRGAGAPVTIKATVDHFNAVVKTVTSTLLDAMGSRTRLKDAQARAKVISSWISIAQECRRLKNFSSLKAILSGLQSTPIHRLKKTWPLLSREMQSLYEELSEIVSDDLNSKASRDLLIQEGTAKYATIDGRASRKSLKKRHTMMNEGVMQGTVPYLGTFLTDLTMIDSAHPNNLENGYINFDKRRKEFEVIAQIKLLQQAAKNYQFQRNPEFITWFHSIRTYSEKESYELSRELEPDIKATTPQMSRRQATLKKHGSVPDLLAKLKLVADDDEDGKSSSRLSALLSKTIGRNISPVSSPTLQPLPLGNNLTPEARNNDGQVAKIMIDGSHEHVYKSILVSVDDRTHNVIKRSLDKYDIKAKAQDYILYQVIPDTRDLHLPHNTNVLYGVNKKVELKFKLAKKKANQCNGR